MEGCIDDMTVASILPEPYMGDPFPGHDRINHSPADIQRIVTENRPDWRIALEHMKGVYVIHDQLTGEPYGRLRIRRYRHLAALDSLCRSTATT